MFKLDEKELEKVSKWKKEHDCSLRTSEHGIDNEIYVGAIGGALTYCFTPTGLGMITEVKCTCGAEINVTNFEDW